MRFLSSIQPLLSTPIQRQVLLATATGNMVIQMASLPVALSLPTLADEFGVDIGTAAWLVIIYLLGLGSTVLLGARIGDQYGHAKVYFIGTIVSTIGSLLIALSQTMWEIIAWRALSGVGAALIMGNANALLAEVFPPHQRGRAFGIPITGARFGSLIGLAAFGLSLQFASWRLAFLLILPAGLTAVAASIPIMRYRQWAPVESQGRPDFIGGFLLAAIAAALILSGSHLHGGEESFTSSDALSYHLPMHMLFLVLVGVLILVERRVKNPIVQLRHFQQKYFSMSLISNVTFHFSMLATFTLIPILVEEGYDMAPIFVLVALLPDEGMGLIVPVFAGWLYDRYGPKFLRPGAMMLIALGFVSLGFLANLIPFWVLPLLLIPIAIGSSVFNPVNNAAIMSSLPLEHRGFSSGMLETTRELGHALGSTISAAALGVILPLQIDVLPDVEVAGHYIEAFQFASLMVVIVLVAGATLSYFQRPAQPTAIAASH